MQRHKCDAGFWVVLIGVGSKGGMVEELGKGLTTLLGIMRSFASSFRFSMR